MLAGVIWLATKFLMITLKLSTKERYDSKGKRFKIFELRVKYTRRDTFTRRETFAQRAIFALL